MDQVFVERTEQFLKDTFPTVLTCKLIPQMEHIASSTPTGWPIWPSTSPNRKVWT